jgi:5-methyltetrahydrofolate corrinoid/iron sulfur protein methyltransferase
MFIIGELINCTRKRVGAAAQNRDASFIQEVARNQTTAGADMLDVNGGLAGQEAECLAWLVGVVQDAAQTPLCLDSSDPEALRRALPLCKKRPMINSITDEPARFQAVLPLLKEFRPRVIALCMSAAGPPSGVEDQVATTSRLVDHLTAEGMALDDIYVDPCVLPASTGPEHGAAILEAVGQIKARYSGVHISAGVSNVSYGLPLRKLLNEVFLVLLLGRGLDAPIVDPCDQQMMMNLRAAEALIGRDEYCVAYLRAFRDGKLELKAA